ncbi:MAG TPA: D-alanyl-D-alanine carboxypeptidase family protein [Clostridiaceae bacterium]
MEYYVKIGDTLYLLAKRFNTTIYGIIKRNNLNSYLLYPGQKLIIPITTLPKGIYGLGSRGDKVRIIQQILINMGYTLKSNGIYGPYTETTIINIQKKYPDLLIADGLYEPKTKLLLQNLYNSGYHIVQEPSSLLVVVNKNRVLLPTYTPNNLVIPNIPAAPEVMLRADAAKALEELFAKAKLDNIFLYGVSGYRSYDRQVSIFTANVKRHPNANFTSARPGESEHQTGLAIDVSSPSVGYRLSKAFADTPEGKWLQENASEFGFIIRFSKGKEAITGYDYEPWHIRYVGKYAAQKIAAQKSTLEEYLGVRTPSKQRKLLSTYIEIREF